MKAFPSQKSNMNSILLFSVLFTILTTGCSGAGRTAVTNRPTVVPAVTLVPTSIAAPADTSKSTTPSPTTAAATSALLVPTVPPTSPIPGGTSTPSVISKSSGIHIPSDAKACSLLAPEKVEIFLGEKLTPQQDFDYICLFVGESQTKSVTINIYRPETAKLSFLNIIAQHKNGCTLSFSGGTSVTPTLFSPEIVQLSSKPLNELAEMVLEGYEKCDKDDSFEIIEPTLGDASFLAFYNLGFMQTALLTVVSGDLYVEFTFAAPSKEEVLDKKEALINLVATSLAELSAR